jgi:hypothetical protein
MALLKLSYFLTKILSLLPYYFFRNSVEIREKETIIIDYGQQEEVSLKTIEFKDDEVPNKSNTELVKLGMLYFSIELLFSMEVALTVPLMLKLKVSEEYEEFTNGLLHSNRYTKIIYFLFSVYSFVYFLSPFIGFLAQPVLGAFSDKLGQRKPFILALAIGAYIGIFFILNGYILGQYLGDREHHVKLDFLHRDLFFLYIKTRDSAI